MIPEVYVDGIGRIGFVDGMIRIELISRSGGEPDAQGRPKAEVRQRLVMTLGAFLQSLQAQQSVIVKLQEAGVLQAQTTAPGNAPTADAPASPPKSPNFHLG